MLTTKPLRCKVISKKYTHNYMSESKIVLRNWKTCTATSFKGQREDLQIYFKFKNIYKYMQYLWSTCNAQLRSSASK